MISLPENRTKRSIEDWGKKQVKPGEQKRIRLEAGESFYRGQRSFAFAGMEGKRRRTGSWHHRCGAW